MITIDAPPGELNVRILSSILNLVCPQCGGRIWNTNVKGDPAEIGFQNGSGQIGGEKLYVPASVIPLGSGT